MSDAWDTLAAVSSGSDAWERINAITGGGGGYLADKQLLFETTPAEKQFSVTPLEVAFTADAEHKIFVVNANDIVLNTEVTESEFTAAAITIELEY